jgi:hypothetical protein
MKNKLSLLILIISAVILFSCGKGSEESRGGGGLVYYDFYADYRNASTPVADELEHTRVCFNLATGSVVWQERNSKIIPRLYWEAFSGQYGNGYGSAYQQSFETSDAIIRIYPGTSDFTNPGPYVIDAVYFQKINKQTGEETIITLIPGNEIPDNSWFSISQVVSDGTNFFFHAVNGFIYCVMPDGAIKWKIGDYIYVPGNVSGNNWRAQWSYVYLYNQRLYTVIYDQLSGLKFMIGFNTQTGAEEDGGLAGVPPYFKQYLFGANHYAHFAAYGSSATVTLYPYGNGDWVATHTAEGRPVTTWNDDKTFVYLTSDAQLKFISTDNRFGIGNISGVFKSDNNYVVAENKKIYGAAVDNITQTVTFTCANTHPDIGGNIWTKTYSEDRSSMWTHHIYNYFVKDDKMYIFASFRLERDKAVINTDPSTGNGGAVVIVLNAKTGELITQYKGLPIAKSKDYNVYSQGMFNIVMED